MPVLLLIPKTLPCRPVRRTFEAAALLRRSGADPNMVRQLFKDDLDSVQVKSRLVAEAEMPEPGMVISVYENATKRS